MCIELTEDEKKRWESTDAFVVTCKAFEALDYAHEKMGNPDRRLNPTLEDINGLQDALIIQGYSIQKIK